jgi:hypothetical protein
VTLPEYIYSSARRCFSATSLVNYCDTKGSRHCVLLCTFQAYVVTSRCSPRNISRLIALWGNYIAVTTLRCPRSTRLNQPKQPCRNVNLTDSDLPFIEMRNFDLVCQWTYLRVLQGLKTAVLHRGWSDVGLQLQALFPALNPHQSSIGTTLPLLNQ